VPPSVAADLLMDLHNAGISQAAIIGEVTREGRGEIDVD